MKYSKPDLHFVSTTKAFLHCTDGSTPGAQHECTTGLDFAVDSCASGDGAHASCNIGTGASSTCVGGSGVGLDCVTGGTP